jgi:TatD DNase family protein
VGECGLDYYYKHSTPEQQVPVFSAQIELAKKINKALVIHVRDAWDDCAGILEERRPLPQTIIHCFTGTAFHAKRFLTLGCFLSLSGIVTFKEPGELVEVAKITPLDKLLIETDAPYLAPIPHRGKRNEPSFIVETARVIAQVKGLEERELAKTTWDNACRVFGL